MGRRDSWGAGREDAVPGFPRDGTSRNSWVLASKRARTARWPGSLYCTRTVKTIAQTFASARSSCAFATTWFPARTAAGE